MDIRVFFQALSTILNALNTFCCNSWVSERFEHWKNCEESKRILDEELTMLRALLGETEGIVLNETMEEYRRELRGALEDGSTFLRDHLTVPSLDDGAGFLTSCLTISRAPCARIKLGRGAAKRLQTIQRRMADYQRYAQAQDHLKKSEVRPFVQELRTELKGIEALLNDHKGTDYADLTRDYLQELRGALDRGKELLAQHSGESSADPRNIESAAEKLVQSIHKTMADYKRYGKSGSQVKKSKLMNVCLVAKKRVYPVPDLVVGMDYQGLVELVLSSDAHRIGICGQGGCGKTLLTHLLQNDKNVKDHFQSRVYYIEVGKKDSPKELLSMLHKEITEEIRSFDSEATGKAELYTLLKDSKCLLVIDNVWDLEKLECLNVVEPKTGSKILATTRNSELLDEFQAKKWIIEQLSDTDSQELFCKYAFGDVLIDGKIKDIANDVIKHFNGLPLALKLMGSSMSSKKSDLCAWQKFQRQIKRAGSINNKNKKLYECLKFTYDELSPKIQECFLDLALIQSEFSVYGATLRWKSLNLIDSDDDAASVLDTLLNLFLLSDCDPNNEHSRVKVHDIVQGLATYIMHTDTKKSGQLIRKMEEMLTGFSEFSKTVQKIQLGHQELEWLPEPITSLKVEVLELYDNPLSSSGIPRGFFQAFPNLKVLDLDRIKAEIAVERLAGLRKLELLHLSRDGEDYRKQGHFCCKADQNKALDLNLKFVCVSNYCPSFLTSSSIIQELHIVVSYQCLLHLPKSLRSSKTSLKRLSIFICDIDTELDVADKEKEDENICLFADMEFKHLQIFSFHIGKKLSLSKISFISKMNWQAFRKLERLSLSNLDWSQVTFTSFLELQRLDIYDCIVNTIPHAIFDHSLLSKGDYDFDWKHPMLQKLPDGIETLPQLRILNVAMCPIIDIKCEEQQGNFPQLEKLLVHSTEEHVPVGLKSQVEVVQGYAIRRPWATPANRAIMNVFTETEEGRHKLANQLAMHKLYFDIGTNGAYRDARSILLTPLPNFRRIPMGPRLDVTGNATANASNIVSQINTFIQQNKCETSTFVQHGIFK